MKYLKFLLPLAIAGAATLAGPVSAQDTAAPSAASHWYVGGSAGQASWRGGCANGATCDDTNATLAAFAGYTINRIFSVEGGFRNLGEAKGTNAGGVNASVKAHGWEIDGIAAWPIVGDLSVYGKAGVYRMDVKGDGALTGNKQVTVGGTYGAGLQYEATKNLALRAEYQFYSSVGGGNLPRADIGTFAIGALWRFR